MCWSLLLLALTEAAKDDAAGARRRAERVAAKKQNGFEDASAQPVVLTTDDVGQGQEVSEEASFRKIFNANMVWAQEVLHDAIVYARSFEPRPVKSLNQAQQEDEISASFYSGLWPALKARGWKEEIVGDGKRFTFNNFNVSHCNEHACHGTFYH